MRTPLFPFSETLPRLTIDFVSVHFSMLSALAFVNLYYAGYAADSQALARELRHYYLNCFLPASPLFALVLCLTGVYSFGRSYRFREKLLLIARSVGVAVLLTLAANYFLFRTELVARSVTALFTVFVAATIMGGRTVAWLLVRFGKHEAQKSKQVGPVLVVGGAGYIGSILCEQLLREGNKVRVLDSLVYGDSAVSHLKVNPNFELIRGDCRNIQTVVSAVKGSRAIVHLAAIVGDPACDQDRQSALEINYAATRMLVEIAKGHGIERFLFASSCSVYGVTDVLMNELSQVHPISIYGQTKADSEEAILAARSDTFHPTIMRLATVYGLGPRPRFDLVVNLLTARAVCDGVITVFNGEQWRPFIHVRDVARGFATALSAPIQVVSGQTYNLGDSEQNYTLAAVAEEIRKLMPNTRVQNISNSDRRNYRVSFSKIERELGFRSLHSVPDGIAEIRDAFERGSITDYSNPQYNNQKALQSLGPLTCRELDSHVMAAFVSTQFHQPPPAPQAA